MHTRLVTLASAALFVAGLLTGCVEAGKVDQGRTVAFDKDKRTVTIIRDKAADAAKPEYSVLPAVTYKLPANPAEMGPDPKAGLRMQLDADKGRIVLYDPEKRAFDTIPIQIVDRQDGIDRKHPLVHDPATGEDRPFPQVDTNRKTVTVYSGRQKMLVTFQPPEQYLSLPAKAWEAGDEIRVYYKDQGVALRLMNVSRTDIFKK